MREAISRQSCARNDWKYVNYTLDTGFLDSLIGREDTYRPTDFLRLLHLICENKANQIIVVDELEPLLGLWRRELQERFFDIVGHATNLGCGVVLVTRLRTARQLSGVVPGPDHIFELERAQRSKG